MSGATRDALVIRVKNRGGFFFFLSFFRLARIRRIGRVITAFVSVTGIQPGHGTHETRLLAQFHRSQNYRRPNRLQLL